MTATVTLAGTVAGVARRGDRESVTRVAGLPIAFPPAKARPKKAKKAPPPANAHPKKPLQPDKVHSAALGPEKVSEVQVSTLPQAKAQESLPR